MCGKWLHKSMNDGTTGISSHCTCNFHLFHPFQIQPQPSHGFHSPPTISSWCVYCTEKHLQFHYINHKKLKISSLNTIWIIKRWKFSIKGLESWYIENVFGCIDHTLAVWLGFGFDGKNGVAIEIVTNAQLIIIWISIKSSGNVQYLVWYIRCKPE